MTLPLLRPALLFVLVTTVIGSFQVFDTVYVMTAGGPGNATNVANLNIYNTAFAGFRIGEASAMSVALFLIILRRRRADRGGQRSRPSLARHGIGRLRPEDRPNRCELHTEN